MFWLNTFSPSKPGAGLSNTKVPRELVPVTVVGYKKVCRLHPGKYVQVHQEYESLNTINIDQTVGAIVLGSQYNLQGDFF